MLPSRLRHSSPSEGPSNTLELLQRFLSEETKGPLRQKRIKSWEEWMQGMRETTIHASSQGQPQLVSQSLHYIRLMSDLKDTYGWAAAEFYWYELQKEVASQVGGSQVNPRVMFDLKAKFQPLAGRQRATAPTTAITPGAAPGAGQRRGGLGRGNISSRDRTPTHQCEVHGPNFSHGSAECKVLLNKRQGGATSGATNGSSGSVPAKHS